MTAGLREPVTAGQDRLPRAFGAEAAQAAWVLRDEHSGDFLRLQRLMERPDPFQLIIAEFNAPGYRDGLIAALDAADWSAGSRPARWELPEPPDVGRFQAELARRPAGSSHLHLIGLDRWLAQEGEAVLRDLNYRREAIAAAARLPLVVWLAPGQVRAFASHAPDLWAWRGAVLDFALRPHQPSPIERASLTGSVSVELESARRRLAQIDAYLGDAPPRATATASLLLEAAQLRYPLGDWEPALAAAEEAARRYRELDNARGEAAALAQIADILQARGELDEALCILKEDVLDAFERLGDVREKAVTQGKIADILQARGELDEALRILEEEVLVAFERLGDADGIARARFSAASIRLQRGDHDIGGMQRIHDDLAKSFAILQRLRRPDGIGTVGGLFARVLAMRGRKKQALQVLEKAKQGFEKIGSDAGLAQVRALRKEIKRQQMRS